MDNIYVLNYLANRQTVKKGGKLTVLFVDLKAAFDSANRKVLMREIRRVREELVERVEELLR